MTGATRHKPRAQTDAVSSPFTNVDSDEPEREDLRLASIGRYERRRGAHLTDEFANAATL
jgi:hypothetical protein